MHTGEIYKRWVFICRSEQEGKGERMVGEGRGAGGKLTQPSGVVKRLRVGSTDCVGLTSLSPSQSHTRARSPHGKSFSFPPRPSFGLSPRFMRLQVSAFTCVCSCFVSSQHVTLRSNKHGFGFTMHLTSVRLLTISWLCWFARICFALVRMRGRHRLKDLSYICVSQSVYEL